MPLICTPTPGFYLAPTNCASNWKSKRGRLLQWGPERRKIEECEAAGEKKVCNVQVLPCHGGEKEPRLVCYTLPLWCRGNSSAYECYCTTLNYFMQLGETRTGWLFPPTFPFPLPIKSTNVFLSIPPPVSKPSTEQEQARTLVLAVVDAVLSISTSIPGPNRLWSWDGRGDAEHCFVTDSSWWCHRRGAAGTPMRRECKQAN